MTAWTYATLKAALKAAVENQSTDLDTSIDTLIGLGEDRVVKDLDIELFDTETDITIATTGLVTKPAGCIAIRDARYMASAKRFALVQKSREYVDDYWPDRTVAGTPKFWCEYSTTQILVVPPPSGSTSGKATIIVRPTGLSSGNTASWLGTNAPDLLYYACLTTVSKFEIDAEQVGLWEGDYAKTLDRTKVDLRRLIRKDYATVTKTSEAEGER